jgi:2-polyprenyl-3-methyl-5-hydroxy-6-metoxy-1,4-benzoquinol methylase
VGISGYNEDYTYFLVDRAEIAPYVPRAAKRVLDIGCDQGGFGKTLRQVIPDAELVGVEPVAAAAEAARQHYDTVHTGLFPEALPDGEPFDAVFYLDVLEHLPDPWTVLEQTRDYVAPEGIVIASIPNIRYLPVVLSLLFRGRFEYTDYGVLDRTHLRFFTRSTIIELFEGAGFTVERIQGLAAFPTQRRHAPLRVLRPLMRGAKWRQYVVVATVARG